MNRNEKTGHTTRVPADDSHRDSTARKLSSWPEAIIEPPFAVTSAAAYADRFTLTGSAGRAKPLDVAVIGIVLRGYGVTLTGGGVPRRGHGVPLRGHGVPREGADPGASFGLVDAAAVALEWVAQDLRDTAFMLLLRGCQWYQRGPVEPPAASTWKVYGSVNRWSVSTFEGVGSQAPIVGLFADRTHREAAPMWVWHHLAGRILLDPKNVVMA